MTDSVAVFPPGFRVTDNSTGAPVSGAVIEFYDAETSNPKTVYADEDLETALGTTITCDSLGYPTSDGTTKTQAYVGTASYKIVAKTSGGTVLWTHDNVKGAVEVINPGDTSVIATTPVVVKSLDYTILVAHQSTEFKGSCSSADVKFELPSAVDAGDGWFCWVTHSGSANQVLIETVSSQTISSGATSYSTMMVLTRSGESVKITSDGGNWQISAHTTPHIKAGQGIVTITDRLSAPPGSEVNGAFYLLTSSPSGAWSSFAEHDIVQYTSSAWVRFTPLEGWQVWVADEDLRYTFTGSTWLSEAASTSARGIVEKATSAEVVAGTADKYADAADMKYHPGIAKFWASISVSGGTPTLEASHNVSGIVDNGTGDITVTIDTDFASEHWVPFALVKNGSSNSTNIRVSAIAAGSVRLQHRTGEGSNTETDPTNWYVAGLGTQ